MVIAASQGAEVLTVGRRRWRIGLSNRIIALAVVSVAVTALAVGGTILTIAQSELIAAEETRLARSLPREAELISARLAELRGDTVIMAGLPVVQRLATLTPDTPEYAATVADIEGVFLRLAGTRAGYQQVRLIGVADGGREIVRVNSGADGPVVVPEEALQQKGDRPYFIAASALSAGEVFVSDIELNQENGVIVDPPEPVLRTATPVYRPDGTLFGVIVINVLVPSWVTGLGDSDGTRQDFLVSNDLTFLYSFPTEEVFPIDEDSAQLIRDQYPQLQPIFAGEVDAIRTTDDVRIIYGERIDIGAEDPSRFFLLTAVTEIDEVLAGAGAMRDWTIAVAVPIMLLAGLVSLAFGRRIAWRVRQMGTAADEVARGNLAVKLDGADARGDELEVLAATFNSMASDLRSSLVSRDRLAEEVRHRAKAQADLQATTEELAAKAAELEAKAAELEVTNRELEAFSYSVSHDLRAPLRSIDGFSLALVEDFGPQFDANGRDLVRRVREATIRMGRLIDDLLKLSRVARAPIDIQDVDLSAMAGEISARLREREPERKVATRIVPGVVIPGDPHLLAILLGNLLENAWKYSARAEAAVIEFGPVSIDRGAGFFIRDNGVGFDMSYADKLFKPFQRLHASADFAGTGIGLATAARVVHRHQGTIDATAEEDHGATFTVILWRAGLPVPMEAEEVA